MSNSGINSFRLRREDDGAVTLEFGHRPRAEDGMAPPDPSVGFTSLSRVMLTPTAAWRLVAGLSQTLQRPYAASAHAAAQVAPAAPAAPAATVRSEPTRPAAPPTPGTSLDLGVDPVLRQRGATPLNLPHDPMAEAADWLREAVRAMSPEHVHERSFRLAPGKLQANRFLLSINSRQLPGDALERSWAICRHLGLPEATWPDVERAFAGAAHLHFGFEGEPGQIFCKLYLERQVDALEAAQCREAARPALLHTAFKWDRDTGRHVVSHYHWWPQISALAMVERIAARFDVDDADLAEQAQSVLHTAAQRVDAQRLQYLEVAEEGQPRRSFDLNVYDANLTLRDVQPVLFALRDRLQIGPSRFQALYDQVKGRRLGHLAGGVHRDGRPFFNVYFGASRQG